MKYPCKRVFSLRYGDEWYAVYYYPDLDMCHVTSSLNDVNEWVKYADEAIDVIEEDIENKWYGGMSYE